MNKFDHTSISIADAPNISFRIEGDKLAAELGGATLTAEARQDGRADMRIVDATGFVLVDIVVNERTERNLTENVMDISAAFLWSHWRWLEAHKVEADAIAQTNGDAMIDKKAEATP